MNTIEIPDLLAYPDILELHNVPELNDQLVYIIDAYALNGLAVLIHRHDGHVIVRVGDWNGKLLDPKKHELVQDFLNQSGRKLITMMKTVGIPSAIFYIAHDNSGFQLVDVRLSLNKFSGPGMVRDLFSKVIQTQDVKKIVQLDDKARKAIKAGKGNYTGNLIIKSSVFSTIERKHNGSKAMYPLYAKVVR